MNQDRFVPTPKDPPFDKPQGWEMFRENVCEYFILRFPAVPWAAEDLEMLSYFSACVFFDPQSLLKNIVTEAIIEAAEECKNHIETKLSS